MKFIFINIILIIYLINIIKCDEPCSWPEFKNTGDECENSDDCEYPNFCKDNVCTALKQQNDDCTSDEECGFLYNEQAVCRDNVCQINLKNGDPCGEGHPGICSDGTVCEFSRCNINGGKCKFDQDCPFNHYCEDTSSTCTPIVTQNTCKRDTMCPITHICYKSQCIPKFTKESGEPCFGNGELCNVFGGDQCDQVNKICRTNDKYGSSCYVDGDCGSGKCICDNGRKTCVGSNTTLSNTKCLLMLNEFMGCSTKNNTNRDLCSSLNPILCPCFKQYECFRYECYGNEHFNPKKNSYYKSLNCMSSNNNNNQDDDSSNDNGDGDIYNNKNTKQKSNASKLNLTITILLLTTLLLVLLIL